MLRFCDQEIYCITESELNSQWLLNYVADQDRTEQIYVLDEEGKYVGYIVSALACEKDCSAVICRDFVFFDENIWKNGHTYFADRHMEGACTQRMLLPVVDCECRLLCFAWQDDEANRELRMLDELTACADALNFRDIYPQYDCVIIHGCNELSYYFALYLKKLGVRVNVTGVWWERFEEWKTSEWKKSEELDYRILEIYGEGIASVEKHVEERDSVSADFECINHMYETNLRQGIIQEINGKFTDLLEYLSGKSIGIIGVGEHSIYAYNLLLEHGIDLCCFISDKAGWYNGELLGKKILGRKEAVRQWEDMLFLRVDAKHSAWGAGEADYYHYIGYQRNIRYFLLEDYIQDFWGSMKNILRHLTMRSQKRLVLTGDRWLCFRFMRMLETYYKISGEYIVFCDILEEFAKDSEKNIEIVCGGGQMQNIYLLLLPAYYWCFTDSSLEKTYRESLVERYRSAGKVHGITDLFDYPVENTEYMRMESLSAAAGEENLKVGQIIISAINYCSGNILFDEIMEKHPDILMIRSDYLSCNLCSFCMRLAEEKGSAILPLFWRLYAQEAGYYFKPYTEDIFHRKDMFNRYMENMLEKKERFTSQELFIMIHVAYAKMMGREIDDFSEVTIYWEPHNVPRDRCEEYAQWLKGVAQEGYIVNIVRDAYKRAGSVFKRGLDPANKLYKHNMMISALRFPNSWKKEYTGWKRIVLKFEDLKCNPREVLHGFFEKIKIAQAEQLWLNVKADCGEISGFDLTPVYRIWEEYFSSFDRFRISLITGPWQKMYGYPHINSYDFSRRELKEMFSKEFRFEKEFAFESEEEKRAYWKWREKLINNYLWDVRRMNFLEMCGEKCNGNLVV